MVDPIRRPRFWLAPTPPWHPWAARKISHIMAGVSATRPFSTQGCTTRAVQPTPQTPPVSHFRRQHVHVNRKADVLDQVSNQFWPLFTILSQNLTPGLKPSRVVELTVRETKQKHEHTGPAVRSPVQSVRFEIGFVQLCPSLSLP